MFSKIHKLGITSKLSNIFEDSLLLEFSSIQKEFYSLVSAYFIVTEGKGCFNIKTFNFSGHLTARGHFSKHLITNNVS